MHLILFSFVVPAMFLIPWSVPSARQPIIWSITLGIVTAIVLVILGVDLAQYLASSPSSNQPTINRSGMRIMFTMIMMTNFPWLAVALGSCINWTYSRFFNSKCCFDNTTIAESDSDPVPANETNLGSA